MSDKNGINKNKVLQIRKEKNLTQNQLMYMTGISPKVLVKIEKNLNKSINQEHFIKIANALGVKYNDLFEEPADSKLKKLQIEDYEKITYETYLNLDFVKALVEETVVKTEKTLNAISNMSEQVMMMLEEIKKNTRRPQYNHISRAGKRYSKHKKK